MKIDALFIHPPYASEEVYGSLLKASGVFPPLGISYLASCLEEEGYKVRINDYDADGVKPEDSIKRYNPTVVAISATSPVFRQAIRIAKIAKEEGCTTMIGGPHPTATPKATINNSCFDYLVYGEGENTIRDLMNSLEKNGDLKKVDGIFYKEKNKIVRTKPRKLIEDIDTIPFPAYHLLPMKKYRFYAFFDTGIGFSTMLTNRGCPFGCIFCNTRTIFGSSLRFRSPKKILDEVELVYNKYKVKDIYFYDDALTLSRKHVEGFCNEMKKRKIDLKWSTETRVDKVDFELLDLMKKSGCYMVGYGFESADQKILNNLKKGTTIEQNAKAVKATRKTGMICRGFFMLGSPGETVTTMSKTINFSIKNKVDFAHFNITTPYPGTPLWDMGVKEGKLKPEDAENTGAIANVLANKKIIGSELSSKTVKKYWKKANLKFYLRPWFIYNLLKRIENHHHLKRTLEASIGFFLGGL